MDEEGNVCEEDAALGEQEEGISSCASEEVPRDRQDVDDKVDEPDLPSMEAWEGLRQEVRALKDQQLRKLAEMENFKKRLLREKQEAVLYANQRLLLDIATVLDNFERALSESPQGEEGELAFRQGVELIYRELVSMLEKNYQFESFGEEKESFDPHKHEALSQEVLTATEVEYSGDYVQKVFQKGYALQGKVVRPAKVKIQTCRLKEE